MKEITVDATIDNLDAVTDFANGILDEAGCPMKMQMQMAIAIDELFSNVAYYAYQPGTGPVTLQVDVQGEIGSGEASLTFIDSGVAYDPLKKEDPDVHLSAEERNVGGLGIFMVKKSMDSVEYRREDEKNILTIRKKF